MPAPLADVDLQAVEAHVVTHGVRDAAKAFNLPVGTVAAWSARRGWLKNAGQSIVVQPLPKSMQSKPSGANTAPIAARISRDEMRERTQYNMAKTADKGFKRASAMKPELIIAQAADLKALAGMAQIAHPELREDSQSKGALISLHFNALPIMADAEVPAIDV